MKVLVVLFSFLLVNVQASDLAKEQRWADQTVDSIMDGEAVWLKSGDLEFLSIFTEAEEASDKGMIVVHGIGIHPNWDQVVKPVRVEMTTHGWNTISIQMPVLANEASEADYVHLFKEVPARIRAAEDYLLSQNVNEIVIVAHSLGAAMSAYYLAQKTHKVEAFVAIGMQATSNSKEHNAATTLNSIDIPVLDIYGSDDLPGVLKTANKKMSAAAHNKKFQQQVIPGADHFFDNKNDELIAAIQQWLAKIKP